LQAVHLAERLLQHMQRAVGRRHALDGADIGAVRLHGEHGARLHRLAVEIDRAGAAVAGLAADMRTGEVELLAQEVDQQGARLDQRLDALAVHGERDVGFGHGDLRQPARDLARASARVSITPAIFLRYSGVPRRSEAGEQIASAAATAFFTVAASSPEPARIFAASSAHSGVSATLVSPIEQVATRPPLMVSTTAAAAVA